MSVPLAYVYQEIDGMKMFMEQGAGLLVDRDSWTWRDETRRVMDPFWNVIRLLLQDAANILDEVKNELSDKQLVEGMTMLTVFDDETLSVCIAACDEAFGCESRSSKKIVSGYLAAHLLTDVLFEKYGKAVSQTEGERNA